MRGAAAAAKVVDGVPVLINFTGPPKMPVPALTSLVKAATAAT